MTDTIVSHLNATRSSLSVNISKKIIGDVNKIFVYKSGPLVVRSVR